MRVSLSWNIIFGTVFSEFKFLLVGFWRSHIQVTEGFSTLQMLIGSLMILEKFEHFRYYDVKFYIFSKLTHIQQIVFFNCRELRSAKYSE